MNDVMRELPRRRRHPELQSRHPANKGWLRYATVLLIAVVVLVGCSGGSGSSKSSASSTGASAVAGTSGGGASVQKFLACLAQHGVTTPSTTPGATIPAGGPVAGASGTPATPPGGSASSTAVQACQSLRPAGFGPGTAGGLQVLQAFVSCMSDHGVKLTAANPSVLSTLDRTTPPYKTCSPLLPSGTPPTSTSTIPA
jgi:uncharacterized spore protein YtfJ